MRERNVALTVPAVGYSVSMLGPPIEAIGSLDPILKGDEAVPEYVCGGRGPAEDRRLGGRWGGLDPSVVAMSKL